MKPYETVKSSLCSSSVFLVLVSLGCHNQIPQPGCLINVHNVFLRVLEAESTKSRCQHHGVRTLVQVSGFMFVTSHGGEGEEALWKLFYKDMNPVHEGHTLLT